MGDGLEPLSARLARVERLVEAARRVADPSDVLGRSAREALPGATGLSREGVEFALTRCLETRPTWSELRRLCEAAPPAPRVHVLLSANVFVAAHRAIALALASSPRVEVRASRREPAMARLLCDGSRGAFRLVEELTPSPGDHVWAYGTDRTLERVRGELPAGAVLHAHGAGLGVALIDTDEGTSKLALAARLLAEDVIAFDQRGCLSPRVALVTGSEPAARAFAESLAKELARLEHDVPRGELTSEELAEQTRYRDAMLYARQLTPAGKGSVGLDLEGGPLAVPPVGRNVQVMRVADPAGALAPLGSRVTCVGIFGAAWPAERVAAFLPRARVAPLGKMQRPPLDGPVDLRVEPAGELL